MFGTPKWRCQTPSITLPPLRDNSKEKELQRRLKREEKRGRFKRRREGTGTEGTERKTKIKKDEKRREKGGGGGVLSIPRQFPIILTINFGCKIASQKLSWNVLGTVILT